MERGRDRHGRNFRRREARSTRSHQRMTLQRNLESALRDYFELFPDASSTRSNQRNDGSQGSTSTSTYSTESGSTASSSSRLSTAPEIPGFYYDPERNRYFRLLPGHNNYNPLTNEMLRAREHERRRSAMLLEDEQPRKKPPRKGLNTSLVLQNRHLGLLHPRSYCRSIHELKVSGMRRHKLEVQSSDSRAPNTDNFRLIVADSTCERVFTAFDVSSIRCKYGIMKLNGSNKSSLSVKMCDKMYFTNRKVNSMCWGSINHRDSHVLLTLVSTHGTTGCVTLLPASFLCNRNAQGTTSSFEIPTAWSCAWSHNLRADTTFSAGLSRQVIVVDADTQKTETYSVDTDVLAQQFALRTPLLYNGGRSGEIFTIDIRQGCRSNYTRKALCFQQGSAVTSVRLLRDENYLLASDMKGKIKLWDIRMRRTLKQFEGHHNEHSYLPLHVNEPEGLLLAVGQDCYTRLWSLGDGHLLRTIPSPQPAGQHVSDGIPNVVFSSQLGGRKGLPGLLMAVRQDLYYYPYTSDYQDTATTGGGVATAVA